MWKVHVCVHPGLISISVLMQYIHTCPSHQCVKSNSCQDVMTQFLDKRERDTEQPCWGWRRYWLMGSSHCLLMWAKWARMEGRAPTEVVSVLCSWWGEFAPVKSDWLDMSLLLGAYIPGIICSLWACNHTVNTISAIYWGFSATCAVALKKFPMWHRFCIWGDCDCLRGIQTKQCIFPSIAEW